MDWSVSLDSRRDVQGRAPPWQGPGRGSRAERCNAAENYRTGTKTWTVGFNGFRVQLQSYKIINNYLYVCLKVSETVINGYTFEGQKNLK